MWATASSVHLADEGQHGCGQWNQTCSLQWIMVCSLSARLLYVEAIHEDSHAPGSGVLLMMMMMMNSVKVVQDRHVVAKYCCMWLIDFQWPRMTLKVIRLCRGFQVQFDEYLCNILHGFYWHSTSRDPSAIDELLVISALTALCDYISRKSKNILLQAIKNCLMQMLLFSVSSLSQNYQKNAFGHWSIALFCEKQSQVFLCVR